MVALNEPYAAFNARMVSFFGSFRSRCHAVWLLSTLLTCDAPAQDELKTWMRAKRFDVASQQQIEEFYAARLGGGSGGKVVDEAGQFSMEES